MEDHLYIYNKNKRGPKIKPCATPRNIFLSKDVYVYPMENFCVPFGLLQQTVNGQINNI